MKTFNRKLALSILALPLLGGVLNPASMSAEDYVPIRADSHAPIGVMGDHLHRKGEFMVSLRTMFMEMEGHRIGESKVDAMEVFERGYSSAAESMEMEMSMLGFMYAPSDKVTLMLMANYLDKEMEMVANPHAGMDGMHGHGHGMGDMSHGTSGWGDASLTALVRAWKGERQGMHWNLGISAPTGSVSEMMHGQFQPYGMQLGSGTWDAKVGATYAGHSESYGWGAQLLGTIRLEDSGESGFARSDAMEFSTWADWSILTSLSVSARLKYSAEGALDGHYNGPHAHSAPPHFQENYGGDVLEALVGLNYVFQEGFLRGHRLALEAGLPVYQQLNGVGMNRKETIQLGWQYAW